MAEFVESRMEEMVSILEKIKQTNLIEELQLKKIIGKLREHELNIQRPARTLEDFFAYFNYLKSVLDLLKEEREKMNYFHQTIEIEDRLKAIICSRFGMANHNFKQDLNFWVFRLKYMIELNWFDHVSNLFTEVTKVLGSKYPQLWIDASNFEWSKIPNSSTGIQTARQFVQLGLRRFPEMSGLFLQGFNLELKYVQFLILNFEEKEKVLELNNGKQIIEDLVLAKSFYNQCKSVCRKEGAKLYELFYTTARKFHFAKNLCDEILEDMKTECSAEEITYDIIAKIELSEGDGKLFQSNIDNCIQLYEEGLSFRPTSKMYDLYINTLLLLSSRLIGHSRNNLEAKLIILFEKAYERWKLSERSFMKWFQFVKSIEENAEEENGHLSHISSNDILQFAYSKYPSNSEILRAKLTKELFGENGPQVQIIQKYMKHFKNDGTLDSLWTDIFINNTLEPNAKPADFEKLILIAPKSAKRTLALLFIKYYACVDMDVARRFYDQNFAASCSSLDFHLEMGQLELTTLNDHANQLIILDRISQCYENAAEYFGENNIEPWLTFIKFEREKRRDAKKASLIYSRALKKLRPTRKEEFILAENGIL